MKKTTKIEAERKRIARDIAKREREIMIETFQSCMKTAGEKFELANTYREDGALMTAAKIYREVADLLEQAQVARNKAMGVQ